MARGRPRQPIDLIVAKGAKHLTKAEIDERRKSEVQPVEDGIVPPAYLSAKQKKEFNKLADQLRKLKIIGETDVDALARYVVANELYIKSVKGMRKAKDVFEISAWSKTQDIYTKQCRVLASDLGLTIASRCKLVVPETKETPKENKFKKFEKRVAGG